jgi:hypothetical protein
MRSRPLTVRVIGQQWRSLENLPQRLIRISEGATENETSRTKKPRRNQFSDGAFVHSEALMNDGVPGQVRTANLPLRRVNLAATPIEETQLFQAFPSGCIRENDTV